jgi:hypothetical protein
MPREHGGKTHINNTLPFSSIIFHTKNSTYLCKLISFFTYFGIPQGVDLTGPKKRNARLRLYGFMMADFSEEQKIQVTAKIVQDMLSYAVDYLRSNNRYLLPAASFCYLLFLTPPLSYPFFSFSHLSSLFSSPLVASSRIFSSQLFLLLYYLHLSYHSNGNAGSGAQTRFEEALRDAFLVLSSPLLKVRPG